MSTIKDWIRQMEFSEGFKLWAATLLFLPITLFLRYVSGTWLVLDHHYPAYIRHLVVSGIIIAAWLIWKWSSELKPRKTGLESYLGLFYLVIAISTAFSENVSLSVEKWTSVAGYLFAIYILIDIKKYRYLWQGTTNAILITAGLSSFISLLPIIQTIKIFHIQSNLLITNPIYVLKTFPRVPNIANLHPSITSGILLLIIPLGFHRLLETKKWIWRILILVSLIFHGLVFLLARSRGGYAGFLVLLIFIALFYRTKIQKRIQKTGNITRIIFLIAFILSIVIAALLVFTRASSFLPHIEARLKYWQVALNIIQEHPVFGSGFGTYGEKYIQYRDKLDSPITKIHPHNQLLHIGVQFGLMGLISFGVLCWQFVKTILNHGRPFDEFSRWIIPGLFGVAVTLLPDAILTSSTLVLLVIYCSVGIFPDNQIHPVTKKQPILFGASFFAVILAISGGWVAWKTQPYYQARKATENQDWEKAAAYLEVALSRDPGNPFYQHALGYTNGQAACNRGFGYEKPILYYERSLDTYHGWPVNHSNLAILYQKTGNIHHAIQEIQQAVDFNPKHPLYHCVQGDFYLQSQRKLPAVESYGKCIALRPHSLDSPYWQENKGRQKILPAVLKEATKVINDEVVDENPRLVLSQLHFYTGRIDLAKTLLQSYLEEFPTDIDGRMLLVEILESEGDYKSAVDTLDDLIQSKPRNARLWRKKGKLAMKQGKWEDAEHALQISHYLDTSNATYWLLGNLYMEKGEKEKASKLYHQALTENLGTITFARDVAARWPLAGIHLECMPDFRSYQGFYEAALNAALLLENQECEAAACIYLKLLEDEPAPREARLKLDKLSCADNITPQDCFWEK